MQAIKERITGYYHKRDSRGIGCPLSISSGKSPPHKTGLKKIPELIIMKMNKSDDECTFEIIEDDDEFNLVAQAITDDDEEED